MLTANVSLTGGIVSYHFQVVCGLEIIAPRPVFALMTVVLQSVFLKIAECTETECGTSPAAKGAMAQNFDQLKQKYASVISMAQTSGHLQNVNMEGDKLYIRAEVANEDVKNQIWNAIKAIDPQYSDLTADIRINSAIPAPAAAAGAAVGSQAGSQRMYTVKPGDTLSAIAERFYGKANAYNKIFEANRDKLTDANHIRAGQELVIPE